MQKLMRMLWLLVWLLAFVWLVVGLAAALDVMADNEIVAEVASQVDGVASGLKLDEIDGYSPASFTLATGLPVLLIATFFIWRNTRRVAAKQADTEESRPLEDSGDAKRVVSARAMRREGLAASFLAFAAVFVLWHSSELEIVVYPLRLFVTFVHEAGHALAALITGGQVHSFTVQPNGSGYAITSGGNMALVLPAGYLGAALLGSLLFLLSNLASRWLSGLAIALGIFMIGLSALYARPAESGLPLALMIGLGYGLAMVLIGAKAPRVVNQFMLSALAIMTALHAVVDLWLLVSNPGLGLGGARNDAAAFAESITPLLPASVVAFMWALIAGAMLAAAIYFGAIKPLRQEIDAAVARES